MCSSYAWDMAINFIQTNTIFTNYATSRIGTNENWSDREVKDEKGTTIKESDTQVRLSTGLTTAKANLYDMGGNVAEYTTELMPGTSETVVFRGGGFMGARSWEVSPSGYRWDSNAGNFNNWRGFRVTLFLK